MSPGGRVSPGGAAGGGGAAGRRVLVARLDSEGDVLLAGPAVRAVAAGAAHVTLLVGPRGRQAAGLLPGVDRVAAWRAPWIDPEPEPVDPVDVTRFTALLAELAVTEAVLLTSYHQSPLPLALLLRLAGVPARVVVGFATGVPGPDGRFNVRDTDAHAWIEVYFQGYGWVA
ncbi:MAG TPA: transglutaminase-like domain-containing protein, partial [Mycobacteriales bacterium]|nr:transglutaminase-like domain-containing protein [Mycobacteriales bacterium]